jgi:uncharacterized protein YbjT (DUF2867 family)
MKTVLLFGATGNLGKEIAKEVQRQGYDLTIVARNKAKALELLSITDKYIVADITNKGALENICLGFEIVISSLGKSVSLNDKSKPTFRDIDLVANSNILEQAKKSGVKKFVYVSALGSENYLDLDYFKVHHEFSEKLKSSGINYSVIKPPAIFCAFVDVIKMSRKGQLMNIGKGDKRTNPIHETDLAKVCVDSIRDTNTTVEAGGPEVYTRKQINEIIQSKVNPSKKLMGVPAVFVKLSLPMIRLFNKNIYDKMAFYTAVLEHDVLAPKMGKLKLEDYIEAKVKNNLC